MNFKFFSDDWRSARSENLFLRLIVPFLIISNILTGFVALSIDRQIQIVPPMINEKMTVSQRNADPAFKRSWGLFIANFIGNVTPSNVDFVNEQLSTYTSPLIFHDMKADLARQVVEIKNNNLTINFEATQVLYEPSSDKVFVLGKSITSGTIGKSPSESRVIEIGIEMSAGKPIVNHLETYIGDALTADVIDRLNKRKARENNSLNK